MTQDCVGQVVTVVAQRKLLFKKGKKKQSALNLPPLLAEQKTSPHVCYTILSTQNYYKVVTIPCVPQLYSLSLTSSWQVKNKYNSTIKEWKKNIQLHPSSETSSVKMDVFRLWNCVKSVQAQGNRVQTENFLDDVANQVRDSTLSSSWKRLLNPSSCVTMSAVLPSTLNRPYKYPSVSKVDICFPQKTEP